MEIEVLQLTGRLSKEFRQMLKVPLPPIYLLELKLSPTQLTLPPDIF
jgi:hypothetical protein